MKINNVAFSQFLLSTTENTSTICYILFFYKNHYLYSKANRPIPQSLVHLVEVHLLGQNNSRQSSDIQIGVSTRNLLGDQESELETKKLCKYHARKISEVLPPFQNYCSFNISFLLQNKVFQKIKIKLTFVFQLYP